MKALSGKISIAALIIAMTFAPKLVAYAAESEGADNNYVEDACINDSRIEEATECDYYLPTNTDSSSEYFCFNEEGQRINSDGSFTFSFSWALQSSYFKPANSTIRIYATATSDTNNKTYYINLYKDGESNPVKTVKYTANGVSQYADFSGLDTNSYYYMYFRIPLNSTATITGSGQINYIQ